MKPKDFVNAFYKFARKTEEKTGISAVFILAQAALESGWGEAAPGYAFFGVKDTDGLNGNEQLLKTTEYSRFSNLKFPEIISIEPVIRYGKKYFKYRVKDYFRKYNTPDQCFDDHAAFFFKNARYKTALAVAHDPVEMAKQVSKAGYATDPDYAEKLIKVISIIKDLITHTT